jgi:type I restriction enzyme S subunit
MRKLVRLGDYTSKIGSGQTPSGGHSSYQQSGIPLIRSQNVLMGDFSISGLAYISVAQDQRMSGSRVLEGDVLLNITGASIGRVCVVPKDMCPGNVNQHVCVIRCNESLVPNYLSYVLASPNFQAFIWDSQSGGTRQALTKQMIGNFEIPWVSVIDQHRLTSSLAAKLAIAEEARQAAQAQLNDTKLLIPAILAAAFDTIADADWVPIGNVAKTISGTTPSRGRRDLWEPPLHPWVKTGEVAFKPINQTEESVSAKALAECSLTLLPAGTVLVAMYGQGKTRGQSALLNVPATTNQACFAILPSGALDPEYLQFWLRHSYMALRSLSDARGGNQSNLNGALMNAFEVPLLPLKKQRDIARRIRQSIAEADELQRTIEAQLKDIELLPSRLLAEVFGAASPIESDGD